jgi:hypothetical protein
MRSSQGSKASWLWKVRQRPKEVPDMRDIHKVGWAVVPVLRLQTQDKAKESQVQGEAQGKDEKARIQSGQAHYRSRKIG